MDIHNIDLAHAILKLPNEHLLNGKQCAVVKPSSVAKVVELQQDPVILPLPVNSVNSLAVNEDMSFAALIVVLFEVLKLLTKKYPKELLLIFGSGMTLKQFLFDSSHSGNGLIVILIGVIFLTITYMEKWVTIIHIQSRDQVKIHQLNTYAVVNKDNGEIVKVLGAQSVQVEQMRREAAVALIQNME